MTRIPETSALELKKTVSVISLSSPVLLPSGLAVIPRMLSARLKATLPIYSDLKHESLIELVEAEEIGDGFAMVFKWADGDCMGRMYHCGTPSLYAASHQ